MKNIKIINSTLFVLVTLLFSCGGSDDGGGVSEGDDNGNGGGEVIILDPVKATLVYPDNNEECTGGVVVSNIETKLNFDWNKSDNTTKYTLYVKNLNTNITEEFNSNLDNLEVTIERGMPYSWYVESKSNKTTNIATSDTWKFYLAGAGIENYVPFPADLKTPVDKSNITTATVNLVWVGGDVDNDIKEYEVYLDTNATPTTKISTTTEQTLENQPVLSSTTYYWKVVTYDANGNTSTSQINSFNVN